MKYLKVVFAYQLLVFVWAIKQFVTILIGTLSSFSSWLLPSLVISVTILVSIAVFVNSCLLFDLFKRHYYRLVRIDLFLNIIQSISFVFLGFKYNVEFGVFLLPGIYRDDSSYFFFRASFFASNIAVRFDSNSALLSFGINLIPLCISVILLKILNRQSNLRAGSDRDVNKSPMV